MASSQVKSDSEAAKVKPFTHFGSVDSADPAETEDYSDPSLVGLNFYSQYGQHDDRPLRLPTTSAPAKVNLSAALAVNISACQHARQSDNK